MPDTPAVVLYSKLYWNNPLDPWPGFAPFYVKCYVWQMAKNRTHPSSQINIFDTLKLQFECFLEFFPHLNPKAQCLRVAFKDLTAVWLTPTEKSNLLLLVNVQMNFSYLKGFAAFVVFAPLS